jgi:imidazole glycerol phosphate synthase glutamine amidotransferase subunit
VSERVVIVPTGTANLASVEAALTRAGVSTERTADADRVRRADRVVLPGVGTFGAAMERIERDGLVGALRDRISEGRPTLAICVGMQVLAETSVESPGAAGLAVWPAPVRRFEGDVRVPQLGWNRVESNDPRLPPGWVYFANSFALFDDPGDGWNLAWSEHGTRFVAAAVRGDVLTCQFHPELSGAYGAARIERWLGGAPA